MEENAQNTSLMRSLDQQSQESIFSVKIILFLILVIFLGIASGYFLSQNNNSLGSLNIGTKIGGLSSSTKGEVVGSDDLKTFKDTTEGLLKEGGIDGEGQFHLVRPGGDSQNVYLTSSIVDLSKFVGKKIKVWGQTYDAQKAGWLMDVGRIEVLD